MSTFKRPSEPYFNQQDNVGNLLLIKPTAYHDAYVFPGSSYDPKAMCEAIVVVLTDGDGPPDGEPERWDDAKLTGGKLAPRLKRDIGVWVLGRLQRGAAKGNQNPPYLLEDPSPEDEAIANDYLESHPDN